jgi:hypothetical protein
VHGEEQEEERLEKNMRKKSRERTVLCRAAEGPEGGNNILRTGDAGAGEAVI